jgi:hypothetical protein
MTRITTKMPAANSVGKNQTITFRLPIGRRFHWLELYGAGTAFTVAHLTEVRVLVNGKTVQRFSGTERDNINKFETRAAAAIDANSFILCIPFDRYGPEITRAAQEDTAIITGSVDAQGVSINTFSLEIDVSNTPTAVTTMDLYAEQSESPAGGPGRLPYLLKSTRDYSSAGTYENGDLPRGGISTAALEALYMTPSTGTLDNLVILANQFELFRRTDAINRRIQTDGIRAPQAGQYVIDRTEQGFAADPFLLVGLNDFRLRFDTSALMTVTTLAKYIGGLAD